MRRVLEDDYGASLLAELQRSGRAEVGGHLHPWCTSPFGEELNARNSYLCNLPETLQKAKLTTLSEQIATRIGKRPTSFRAGRYGLGSFAARCLMDLGYVVDSSVIPFNNLNYDGGPDFTSAPWKPYRMSADDILRPDPNGTLLELPVCAGFSGRNFVAASEWRHRLSQSPWARFRLVGLLDRIGLLRRVKLSPEQADAPTMCGLIDASLAQGSDCLVLMFHSSSLVPGHTPYVRTPRDLEEFHSRLRAVFNHCARLKLHSPTMTSYAGSVGSSAAGVTTNRS
ncbi:MAG: hypothetical protein NT069_23875 [Planctomycetota bacterium]|nr:hypothetical protein [Planctomycetota bacterium]